MEGGGGSGKRGGPRTDRKVYMPHTLAATQGDSTGRQAVSCSPVYHPPGATLGGSDRVILNECVRYYLRLVYYINLL